MHHGQWLPDVLDVFDSGSLPESDALRLYSMVGESRGVVRISGWRPSLHSSGPAGDLSEASAKSSVTITGELVPVLRLTEGRRPSNLLDFLRPKIELRVESISWPSKKHHRKH